MSDEEKIIKVSSSSNFGDLDKIFFGNMEIFDCD